MPVGLSVIVDRQVLSKVFGTTDFTPDLTYYLALSSSAWIEDGTGGTEPVGNAYARTAITNNVTNFPAASGTPATTQNGVAISMPQATGIWFPAARARYWALFSALTVGVMRTTGRLQGTPKAFTVDPTTDFFTFTTHGYILNTPVVFENENGTLPAGVNATDTYYVRDQTANTFKVAATAGGAAIDITTAGTGTNWVAEDRSVDVQNGTTVTIPISGLTIQQL